MTFRQPCQDAVLPAQDATRTGEVPAASSQAGDAAGLGRPPGALAGKVSLAIDALDFAPAPGSTR